MQDGERLEPDALPPCGCDRWSCGVDVIGGGVAWSDGRFLGCSTPRLPDSLEQRQKILASQRSRCLCSGQGGFREGSLVLLE